MGPDHSRSGEATYDLATPAAMSLSSLLAQCARFRGRQLHAHSPPMPVLTRLPGPRSRSTPGSNSSPREAPWLSDPRFTSKERPAGDTTQLSLPSKVQCSPGSRSYSPRSLSRLAQGAHGRGTGLSWSRLTWSGGIGSAGRGASLGRRRPSQPRAGHSRSPGSRPKRTRRHKVCASALPALAHARARTLSQQPPDRL